MTEAAIYSLIGAVAGGQVYPYVVPLDSNGAPAVAAPWVVYSFVSHSSRDTFAGESETYNSLQIDVYAKTLAEARRIREEAIGLLAPLSPGELMRMQSYESQTALSRATADMLLID